MATGKVGLGAFGLVAGCALVLVLLYVAFRNGYHEEGYVSGNVVGMQIDRQTDPELVAALQQMMQASQWLACVPAIQLEKLARDQVRTGIATVKAADVLQVLQKRKNATLANIQRLGVSPAFKAGLIQYATYCLTAITDTLKDFTDGDGFVDLARLADGLTALRGGYCRGLSTNFGTGNSFLPATG